MHFPSNSHYNVESHSEDCTFPLTDYDTLSDLQFTFNATLVSHGL